MEKYELEVVMKNVAENIDAVYGGLSCVISEFAEIFSKELPKEVRNDLTAVAALSWLSEVMHRAVQRHYGDRYELARPVENYNNATRMGYMFCTRGVSDHMPFMPHIINNK